MMYELHLLTERAGYIDGMVNVGLFRLDDTRVVAIDSGLDRDMGKRVRRTLEANGWTLAAICHTHSHADHIGGDGLLVKQYGCPVYATERAFCESPALEPALLYGGASPDAAQTKLLMAQPGETLPLTPETAPEGLTLVPLPGHSPAHVGLRTADGVLFAGDCVNRAAVLQKYPIHYTYEPGAALRSLDALAQMSAAWFVPAHAEPTQDIRPLCALSRANMLQTAERLLQACREPTPLSEAMAQVISGYGLTPDWTEQLIDESTLRGYAAYLAREGRLELVPQGGRITARAV